MTEAENKNNIEVKESVADAANEESAADEISVLKLTSFTQEECDAYQQHWNHDKKVDEDSKGKDVLVSEYTFELNPTKFPASTVVNIKELSYEDKVRFVKFCLSCDCLCNASILSNLVILAQGKLIEEDLYDNDNIFFEDDIEFLDMCTDLREEILQFNTNIVKYFLAALKSLSSLIGDGAVHIPNLYFNTLPSYTLNTISSAMQKVSIDYDELPFVFNADVIVNKICAGKSFVEEFMSELLRKVTGE